MAQRAIGADLAPSRIRPKSHGLDADGGRVDGRRVTSGRSTRIARATSTGAQVTGASRNDGLPPRLRNGLEAMSGLDLSGVRVHYESSRPARIGALAYAQGQTIEIGPGQDSTSPTRAGTSCNRCKAGSGERHRR